MHGGRFYCRNHNHDDRSGEYPVTAQQFSPSGNTYIAIWVLPDVPGG